MPDTTINGYKHHYEDVGSGEPMLFLAGTRFDSAKTWVPFMERNAGGGVNGTTRSRPISSAVSSR